MVVLQPENEITITYQADLQDSNRWHNHEHSQYQDCAYYTEADE